MITYYVQLIKESNQVVKQDTIQNSLYLKLIKKHEADND